MRYIIGVEITDKNNGNQVRGVYGYDGLGLSNIDDAIYIKGGKPRLAKIPVFYNLADARDFLKNTARNFRRDDVAYRPNVKSQKIRKFYLLKLDSPKCRIKLGKKIRSRKNCDIYEYILK